MICDCTKTKCNAQLDEIVIKRGRVIIEGILVNELINVNTASILNEASDKRINRVYNGKEVSLNAAGHIKNMRNKNFKYKAAKALRIVIKIKSNNPSLLLKITKRLVREKFFVAEIIIFLVTFICLVCSVRSLIRRCQLKTEHIIFNSIFRCIRSQKRNLR